MTRLDETSYTSGSGQETAYICDGYAKSAPRRQKQTLDYS